MPVLEQELGDRFLQRAGLPTQILDLVRGCRPYGVARQALLTGFEKLFRPAIIQVLDNPLTATQLGDAVLAAQPGQHDADLLLRRKLPPRDAPNLLHNLLCRFLNRPGFLSHLRFFNGYDGPELLPSSTQPICLMGADAGHTSWAVRPSDVVASVALVISITSAAISFTQMNTVKQQLKLTQLQIRPYVRYWPTFTESGAD